MKYKNQTYEIFLDYFNNFLTTKRCAEYYGISESSLIRIIKHWKQVYG